MPYRATLPVRSKRGAVQLPKHIKALELLQMEYRGEIILTHAQRASAMKCLEFENPKLSAVATTNVNGFAAELERLLLERAIQRSGKVIEHRQDESPKPSPAPIPPHGTPRQGPTIDRRFRRS
jgi:hypothetical protein